MSHKSDGGTTVSLVKPYSVFDDFYRPFEGLFNNNFPQASSESRWLPPVEIKRDGDGYTVEVEVPGFKADEVSVEAHDNVLTIQGERKAEESTEENGIVRTERRYGKFVRRFSLPEGSQPDDIKAEVKNGMLSLTIPHAAPEEPRKITVS